ncbi:conserved hypothetical protein [Candidatus Sulfopaludibacter sp. SbA3]|nr:conserved hypothetical protein [Candidatus Sulfopaludibacter sp. SbA3]
MRKSDPETSPGGSVIHRYEADNWANSPIGVVDESAAGFVHTREVVYQRLFGDAQSVSHEIFPLIPHVDVYIYPGPCRDERDFCTLVTSGMSDLEMGDPAGAKAPRRVELIFYCKEPKAEYMETLRWLAHFPHNQKTWIGAGHTIPNGNPPAPFWGSSILDTILLIPSIVALDRTLPDELILGGEPVHFLWVVPLTTPECELKLAKGVNAILELFGRNHHPHVFDPNRASYV